MAKKNYTISAVIQSTESDKWTTDNIEARVEEMEFTMQDPVLCTSLEVMVSRARDLFKEDCCVPRLKVINSETGETIFNQVREYAS